MRTNWTALALLSVRVHVGEADACMIINGYKQKLPASVTEGTTAVAGNAVARPDDASEPLGIDVQQDPQPPHAHSAPPAPSAPGPSNATGRLARARVRPCSSTRRDWWQCVLRVSRCRRNSTIASALAGAMVRGLSRGRDDRSVQRHLALGQISPQPLTDRRHADPVRQRRRSLRQPSFRDVLNHFESTSESQSGILMHVHSAGLLEMTGGLAIPSFSNPVRMNINNLLGLPASSLEVALGAISRYGVLSGFNVVFRNGQSSIRVGPC